MLELISGGLLSAAFLLFVIDAIVSIKTLIISNFFFLISKSWETTMILIWLKAEKLKEAWISYRSFFGKIGVIETAWIGTIFRNFLSQITVFLLILICSDKSCLWYPVQKNTDTTPYYISSYIYSYIKCFAT